jgi:hypothetical protein
MKTEEAKEIIIKSLKEQTTVKAHEINYQSKGKIAFVQIYGIMSKLIKNGSVQMNDTDNKKSYTLIDADKLNLEPVDTPKVKTEKVKVKEPIEKEIKEKPKQKTGRDLTTYKFNGNEYNKTRLAHAIVSQYVKDKRTGLKGLLEIFPDEIVKPYGMIRKIEEAKEISKDRLRFLIKPDEEIKVRDCVIACSNQWTPDRIEILLDIAKKLGYKIK